MKKLNFLTIIVLIFARSLFVSGQTITTDTISNKNKTLNNSKNIELQIIRPVDCFINAYPTSLSLPSNSGTAVINVENDGAVGCLWTATESATWFSISPTSGTQAFATITLTYQANTLSTSRSSSVNVSGQIINVTQAGVSCPTIYAVSGGGSSCGVANQSIILSGSQSGTTYQLYKDVDFAIGTAISGTGNALTWNQSTQGVYTIMATRSGCIRTMTGNATITTNPIPTIYSLSGGGCSHGENKEILLSGSQTTVNYQLKLNGTTDVGVFQSGTGSAMTWSTNVKGNYQVVGTDKTSSCSSTMTGTVRIENPLSLGQISSNPSGNPDFCKGSVVYFSIADAAASYYTWSGPGYGNSTGGSPFTTYTLNQGGTVKVVAGNSCGTAEATKIVNVEPLPTTIFTVSGSSGCGIGTITLNSSTIGVKYQLKLNGLNVGSPLSGTGSLLTWTVTTSGTYYVFTSACNTQMSGSAKITINPRPEKYTMSGGGCYRGTALTIALDGSQTNVNYQLILNGITNIESPKSGTGYALTWTVTEAGTYEIVGTEKTSLCTKGMEGIIGVYAPPTGYSLTAPSCSNGSNFQVSLSGSRTGVNYQLKKDGINQGGPLAGTGSSISWSQTIAGIYSVTATNPSSGCTSEMLNTSEVKLSPALYNITPLSGSLLGHGQISLEHTQSGVSYTLYRDNMAVGAPVAIINNEDLLNFGDQSQTGTYLIKAQKNTCSVDMIGQVVLSLPIIKIDATEIGENANCTLTGIILEAHFSNETVFVFTPPNLPAYATLEIQGETSITRYLHFDVDEYLNITNMKIEIDGVFVPLYDGFYSIIKDLVNHTVTLKLNKIENTCIYYPH